MAQKKTTARFRSLVMSSEVETSLFINSERFLDSARNDKESTTEFMSRCANNNSASLSDMIRHIYVHIPFCARICPYCAFYKDLLDRSQTQRFCEAIVGELELYQGGAISSSPRRTRDRRSLLVP